MIWVALKQNKEGVLCYSFLYEREIQPGFPELLLKPKAFRGALQITESDAAMQKTEAILYFPVFPEEHNRLVLCALENIMLKTEDPDGQLLETV